jgi:hypothetical protein
MNTDGNERETGTHEATCSHYRIFIALPVPQEVRRGIQRVQEQLRRALPQRCVRWNKPEQLHRTLIFLGNVDAARAVCAGFSPLKLCACL